MLFICMRISVGVIHIPKGEESLFNIHSYVCNITAYMFMYLHMTSSAQIGRAQTLVQRQVIIFK